MIKHIKTLKIVVLGASLMVGAGVAHYYWSSSAHQGPIYEYQESRDTNDMIKLFKQDWYWLSNRDFNEDRLRTSLQSHSPNEYEPRYFGKMGIKVMRDTSGEFIGFVTYYMKNFQEGIIFYLAVRPEFRGKHYGEQLLEAGAKELAKQGACVVSLAVRTDNERAIKLYKRAGMHVSTVESDGFSHMEKAVN
jgi:ribosomal protein S18 acetylase RimI-like enzyme